MADAYTTSASLSTIQTGYDKLLYYALRPELHFDMFADVKSENLTNEGATIRFTQAADLAVASTALNESVDVDAKALSDAQVTVTLAEYGNAVITTKKLRMTSFIPVMPEAANIVGFNAGVSMDTVARDTLKVGTNVRYATGSGVAPAGRTTVTPSNTLRATDIRRAAVDLENANVAKFDGYYVSVIHPDVAFDLRSETGTAAWRDPHTYSQPQEIWNGEIGEFEGFRFIKTNRAPVFADAGSSTTLTDVYRTLFFGRQALAKAYSTAEGMGPQPTTVLTPVTDKLRRFLGVGWYHFAGYGIFRQAALWGVESASSIGTNS